MRQEVRIASIANVTSSLSSILTSQKKAMKPNGTAARVQSAKLVPKEYAVKYEKRQSSRKPTRKVSASRNSMTGHDRNSTRLTVKSETKARMNRRVRGSSGAGTRLMRAAAVMTKNSVQRRALRKVMQLACGCSERQLGKSDCQSD